MTSAISTQVTNGETRVSLQELLELMRYGRDFRFVDEFLEADRTHIAARYRFRPNHAFYADHFPDRPITPGVILLEAMCQCGMTAQGLYLLALETGLENARRHRFLFTNSEAEWLAPVYPADVVYMRSRLLAWRQRRVRATVEMTNESGTLLAKALVCGTGVLWDPASNSTLSAASGQSVE